MTHFNLMIMRAFCMLESNKTFPDGNWWANLIWPVQPGRVGFILSSTLLRLLARHISRLSNMTAMFWTIVMIWKEWNEFRFRCFTCAELSMMPRSVPKAQFKLEGVNILKSLEIPLCLMASIFLAAIFRSASLSKSQETLHKVFWMP